MLTLHNARIIMPTQIIDCGTVVAAGDGRIAYVGSECGAPPSHDEVLDLEGRIVAPGFLDTHTHGGGGVAFGASHDAAGELSAYSQWAVRSGITGFLCTLAAPDVKALLQTVHSFASALDAGTPGAQALGIHLEGPFLNPDRRGAFPRSWLRPPSLEEADALIRTGRGWIRMVTIAPELPGAMEVAERFRRAGIVVALGHTDADYDTATSALRGPFTHVTHTFNAMRGFHHRDPGALGAILASKHITAEVIADGVHVDPAAMRVLVRCLGSDKIVLVTDGTPWAGLPDGEYEWLNERMVLRDGRATLPDGTLAGSVATMDACVRNAVLLGEVRLPEAIQMATLNPARVLGMDARLGHLAAGTDANLVVLDAENHVVRTIIRGRLQP
jgi:N-acetylglucosamine-6-phosphate deacetylase